MPTLTPENVLGFWFAELTPAEWFAKSDALDQRVRDQFGDCHRAVSQGEAWRWRVTPQGRLAEIIVLDQFSRNIYRDQAGAFAWDGMALVLAQEAVARKVDQALPEPAQRAFLYMPYMHSESLAIHEQAVHLFDQPGLENNLAFEYAHQAIIARFGRYPHRNAVLGRSSSAEEIAFLQEPGSSF